MASIFNTKINESFGKESLSSERKSYAYKMYMDDWIQCVQCTVRNVTKELRWIKYVRFGAKIAWQALCHGTWG